MAKKATIEKYLAEHPEHYDILLECHKQAIEEALCNLKTSELREELMNLYSSGCRGFEESTYGPSDLADDLADVYDDAPHEGEPLCELLNRARLLTEE